MIRRVFRMAVDETLIAKNPASGIRIEVPDIEQRVLNQNEAETLLESALASRHDFYEIWTMALLTGMRSGELYALKWADVDLDNDLITVNKQWTSKDGYGPTKSRKNRVVPISKELHKFLLSTRPQNVEGTEFVLPRLISWARGDQAKILNEFCKVCGITVIKFHDLRATFITNLLSKGVPLVKVMAIVGHSRMSTTDRYLRMAGVDLKGETDRLGIKVPQLSEGTVFKLFS